MKAKLHIGLVVKRLKTMKENLEGLDLETKRVMWQYIAHTSGRTVTELNQEIEILRDQKFLSSIEKAMRQTNPTRSDIPKARIA